MKLMFKLTFLVLRSLVFKHLEILNTAKLYFLLLIILYFFFLFLPSYSFICFFFFFSLLQG